MTAAVLLVLAVSGAMLSPVLTRWPGSDARPSTVEAAPGTTLAPSVPPTATPPATTPPVTTRPAATVRPAVVGMAALENRVFELTNAERTKRRCDPLRLDTRLRTAARGYSDEMARYGAWNHIGHDGSEPDDRMRRAGYDTSGGWAENIAKGYATAEAVMDGWMRSPGHRANILNCDLRAIGVGVVKSGGTLYWTQDFGAR